MTAALHWRCPPAGADNQHIGYNIRHRKLPHLSLAADLPSAPDQRQNPSAQIFGVAQIPRGAALGVPLVRAKMAAGLAPNCCPQHAARHAHQIRARTHARHPRQTDMAKDLVLLDARKHKSLIPAHRGPPWSPAPLPRTGPAPRSVLRHFTSTPAFNRPCAAPVFTPVWVQATWGLHGRSDSWLAQRFT